jgi:hypothetical protein
VDRHSRDGRRHGTLLIDEREEIGIGKELTEDLEAALSTTHTGEPIMDQGDLHKSPSNGGDHLRTWEALAEQQPSAAEQGA